METETRAIFKTLHSGACFHIVPETPFSCRWTAKTQLKFYIFARKRCCVHGATDSRRRGRADCTHWFVVVCVLTGWLFIQHTIWEQTEWLSQSLPRYRAASLLGAGSAAFGLPTGERKPAIKWLPQHSIKRSREVSANHLIKQHGGNERGKRGSIFLRKTPRKKRMGGDGRRGVLGGIICVHMCVVVLVG